jgi:hypothetical protein
MINANTADKLQLTLGVLAALCIVALLALDVYFGIR